MGLEAAGMTTVFQCEIDKNCRQTLDYHWADVPKWDDVSTLTGRYILDHCDGVDVVAWGSPCQDLSVAGKRAGLSGERSNLFHQGIRIIKELRELSNGQYPTWSIWENVAGALSSNGGADFGEVLYEMDEAGACFSEWAMLDAQHFGIPQRRRRVFVVSCFNPATAERCPDKLLPVNQSGVGDIEESGQQTQPTATETTGNTGTDIPTIHIIDGRRTNDVRITSNIIYTLEARMGTGGNNVPVIAIDEPSQAMRIRKLTPVETERLMGWKDNHTLHRADGKENSNTNRYKMCGNGVASPAARWIGKQLIGVTIGR